MLCLGCEVVLTLSPKGKAPQVVRKKVSKKSKEGKTPRKERKGKAKGEDPHLPTDAQPWAPADPSSLVGPATPGVQMLHLDSLLTMEDDEEDNKHWPAPVASTSSIVPSFQSLPAIWPFAIWPYPFVASTPSAMAAPTLSLAPIAPAPVPESALLPDLGSLIRMDDGEDHHQDNHTGDVEMRDAEVFDPTMQPELDPDAEEDEGPPDKKNVVVTLVHGDVFVLSGAEFQVRLVLLWVSCATC